MLFGNGDKALAEKVQSPAMIAQGIHAVKHFRRPVMRHN